MAFALIFIGILLFVSAYNNNVAAFANQLKSDVVGSKGFIVWVTALFIVGAVGYIPALKNVSRALLVLIIVVLFLANKGVFTQFTAAITGTGEQPTDNGSTPSTPSTTSTPSTGTAGTATDTAPQPATSGTSS